MNLFGFKIGGAALAAIAAAALMLAAAIVAYLALDKIDTMIIRAVQQERQERDAYWQLEIQKANTKVAQAEAAQARAVIDIQADATDRVNAASQQLEEVRKRNEKLPPATGVGLDAARSRLLPK
ncbi:hypothetical protein CO666_03705 [Rhizobium chutanense]|uniref:Uncharacterized protein n=1 Tax=Rhizobium chutanense TaxID=2035448 RepID=A0A2A6JHK1_9HYPH|nr:hypothetical protein [Rhizobium chutanense]PDT05720.1 hypothetical protein CO666_03705 [Rhizobium chutanense]